jgi:magnesium transporter
MIEILHSTGTSPVPKKQAAAKKGSWVRVTEPAPGELEHLAEEYGLELDLLTDAMDIYETPRIEREGKDVYVYARYCFPRMRDVSTEPLLIINTSEVLITVQRIDSPLLDDFAKEKMSVATTQRTKTFLQILAAVNSSYDKDIVKINKQILSIRTKLRREELSSKFMVEFIDTEENLNEYLIALQPQALMLRSLVKGKYLPLYEDDKDLVEDLTLGSTELIDLITSRVKTIANIRDAYSTIIASNLNNIFKRLTSIGIFLAVPTIVASLYGMNVLLPNHDSAYAFWEIIAIITVLTTIVVLIFKRLKWL